MRSPGLFKKTHIFVVFKLIIPITVVFMHLFWAFIPIWLTISISGSSFWLMDTYFWCYFSWLAKNGCLNLKLAGNRFPPFPYFWSPVHSVVDNNSIVIFSLNPDTNKKLYIYILLGVCLSLPNPVQILLACSLTSGLKTNKTALSLLKCQIPSSNRIDILDFIGWSSL